jgi:hypothetical protein
MTTREHHTLLSLSLPAGTRVVLQPGNLVYELGAEGRLEVHAPKAAEGQGDKPPVKKWGNLCAKD